ncbi:MAG: TIR domain-containing protein [Sphingomicrobium sp.]
MNDPALGTGDVRRVSRPVFVSYATANRKQALAICQSIEQRGIKCWISTRDVAPGANYQEAIVGAIRDARAMVLVFSGAANRSDEIKKEVSLASRYRVPVVAFRIEDVEPSDAFAYELSTRQWIDAFEGRDKGLDALVGRIEQLASVAEPEGAAAPPAAAPRTAIASRRAAIAAAVGVALLALVGSWWWLRPAPASEHSMTVRLAGFQVLSADLPAGMRDAVDAEISAAFNADGVVGVSTASAPPPGSAPAYALGGTIQRDGLTIRVITRLINERSGATLWTNNFNYDGKEASRVPRHIAVDAGNAVRCGLFGASTYRKPLPDAVLRDYMQFCQWHWDPNLADGRKALLPAQRVVAAVPDFSWGWAAVAGGYWKILENSGDPRVSAEAAASGRQAADRGIAIDGRNSEALYIKAMLVDWQDWIGREALLKRAVDARRLDCGCEHHQYGWMLMNVGRIAEAVDQLQQANDMLALYVYTPLTLAEGLVAAGRPDDAKPHFDAAIDLAPNSDFAADIALTKATATGDTAGLLDPKLPLSPQLRTGLLTGYRAAASGSAEAKAQAVRMLLLLPQDQQREPVARLLADLGANHEAFQVGARLATQRYPGPSLFFFANMRQTLNDPGFPALANQLGLIKYWRTTHTRPDVCGMGAAPPFCRLI